MTSETLLEHLARAAERARDQRPDDTRRDPYMVGALTGILEEMFPDVRTEIVETIESAFR